MVCGLMISIPLKFQMEKYTHNECPNQRLASPEPTRKIHFYPFFFSHASTSSGWKPNGPGSPL
jgi:hypothetical protein